MIENQEGGEIAESLSTYGSIVERPSQLVIAETGSD